MAEQTELWNEVVLSGMVRAWTRHRINDDQVAARAVEIALSSYAGGASIAEACEEARKFVLGWIRHPSHWQPGLELAQRQVS
jgi:hypothetical protein